jgi:hypothetical protein
MSLGVRRLVACLMPPEDVAGKTNMTETENERVGAEGPCSGKTSRKTRRSVRRGILLALVAGGAALAIWGAVDRVRNWPVRRFGVVKPGVLYRSAQPTAAGWRALKKEYGIRTVVDLRSDEPEKQWSILQRDFCRDNGIRLIRVAIGPDRLTDDEYNLLLGTLTDPNCQPVLVHCELGKLRTGVVVAAYRIAVDGWSREQALAESSRYKEHLDPGYEEYLRQLELRSATRPARSLDAGAGRKLPSGR